MPKYTSVIASKKITSYTCSDVFKKCEESDQSQWWLQRLH